MFLVGAEQVKPGNVDGSTLMKLPVENQAWLQTEGHIWLMKFTGTGPSKQHASATRPK